MALFTRTLEDRILLVEAASAPAAAPSGTPAWVSVANLQTALNTAITTKKPVFILPCTLLTGPITLAPLSGATGLNVEAAPGTVTLQLNASAPYLLRIQAGMTAVTLKGLIFNGNNLAITATTVVPALVSVDGATTIGYAIDNCEIKNSKAAGIGLSTGASGTIRNCRISNCSHGIFSLDCETIIENNRVFSCANNGISVWRNTIAWDNSVVRGNKVYTINNALGGTGEYGNGIMIFRAGGVKIQSNYVSGCRFSTIRANAASAVQITGNTCMNSREVAIFVESPGAALDTRNSIVSNNVINGAGCGISISNAGFYGDGITQCTVVSGNQVRNTVITSLPDAGYSTDGIGIAVEMEATVTSNIIDTSASGGIVLGTNDSAGRLIASNNVIKNAKYGIGFSSDPSVIDMIVTGNIIRGYRVAAAGTANYPLSGAIVPIEFNDTIAYFRSPTNTTDYGNVTETRLPTVTIGSNRATP